MDELICRAYQAGLTEAEEARLIAWRRECPANETYYRGWIHLLEEISAAVSTERIEAPPLIEDLISPRSFVVPPRQPTPRLRFRRWTIGAAVCAAFVLAFLLPHSSGPGDVPFGTGEIVTGRLESTTVRLGDGTIVRIGPESRLRVTGEDGRREVWLEGRAFFAVSRDDLRPFTIRTHAGDAVVLGTRFDLLAKDDDLQVLVVEGAVRVDARGNAVEVAASERGKVSAASALTAEQVGEAEIQRELSWVGNFVVFTDTPLSLAARELSTRHGVPVEILDSTLARHTVTGVFTDETVHEVARVLCQAVGAHCSIRDSSITIGR